MKIETQQTLDGKTNNIHANWGVFTLHRKQILEFFYNDYTEQGISLVELERFFVDKKGFGFRTLERAVKYLKLKKYISMVAKNVGPTKRRKYYKITELGALAFESLGNRNI